MALLLEEGGNRVVVLEVLFVHWVYCGIINDDGEEVIQQSTSLGGGMLSSVLSTHVN